MPYDDDDSRIRYFSAQTVINHITAQGALQPSHILDLKSTIVPLEIRGRLKRQEGLNDQQIDLLIRFELLRQAFTTNSHMRGICENALHYAQQNKEARESIPPRKEPFEPVTEYIVDRAEELSKKEPKGIPVTEMDSAAYQNTSIQQVVFNLEREDITNVLNDFIKPPHQRIGKSLYEKLKDEEDAKGRRAVSHMFMEEMGRLPRQFKTSRLAPFAARLSALAVAQDFVAVPENMALADDGNTLLVSISSYAKEPLEIALAGLRLIASEYNLSFTNRIEELEDPGGHRRFKPMQARISGEALANTAFLERVSQMIQNLAREPAGDRADGYRR